MTVIRLAPPASKSRPREHILDEVAGNVSALADRLADVMDIPHNGDVALLKRYRKASACMRMLASDLRRAADAERRR